jgi:twitching motility protein PilT
LHSHKKSIVNQREVGSDTYSFANALRSALREDPDVILVGEMRDLETTAIAITAAETGHLVMATLHTVDAV